MRNLEPVFLFPAGMLAKLYSQNLFLRVKMGLRNSFRLRSALGCPDLEFRTLHVAGTNGKGSVSLKAATALSSCGYRTGLFTSPHVSSFRERIKVDGELIGEASCTRVVEHVMDVAVREGIPATFFELVTLASFLHFAEKGCDTVVLETGLGGRLDATNVVYPKVCALTSIGLDHVGILGHTLDAIAYEKAGILKPYVPVVLGKTAQRTNVLARARMLGCPVHLVDEDENFEKQNTAVAAQLVKVFLEGNGGLPPKDIHFEGDGGSRLPPKDIYFEGGSLPPKDIFFEGGDRRLPPKDVDEALRVRPICRLEGRENNGVKVLLDAAHNPDALDALWNVLRQKNILSSSSSSPPQNRISLVLACSSDRDVAQTAHSIRSSGIPPENIYVCEADTPRAMDASVLAAAISPKTHVFLPSHRSHDPSPKHPRAIPSAKTSSFGDSAIPSPHKTSTVDPTSGLGIRYTSQSPSKGGSVFRAIQSATPPKYFDATRSPKPWDVLTQPVEDSHLVIICGSIYMMADARQAIGIQEPRDQTTK